MKYLDFNLLASFAEEIMLFAVDTGISQQAESTFTKQLVRVSFNCINYWGCFY